MPDSTIAINCRALRSSRGLNQEQVAERIGLSRAGYLKIESGQSQPRADTLQKLAEAFSVPIAALVRPVERMENVRFRSKKRINSREELLAEIKRRLDGYAALAQALGKKARPELGPVSKEPAAAAREIRERLGVGVKEPIRDICGLVEARGYRLLFVRLTSAFHEPGAKDRAEGFFGLSVLDDAAAPAVVVNTFERISVERRIFTVAHELGHLHLHRDSFKVGDAAERDDEEREADVFASHLLMPKKVFESEWDQARGLPFVDQVLKVKRIFRVSYKTVLMRLEQEYGHRQLFMKFYANYKRRYSRSLSAREEPSPLDPADFQQDVLPSLVREGVEKEILSFSKAAELLGEGIEDFRERAGLWETTPNP